jgi:cell division protease FtsH
MGGRAAEELIFDHLSTGASNDLEQATSWARRMVCEYGMSEQLGPVAYGEKTGDVFLGRDMITRRDFSEKKSEQIDDEVARVLTERYAEARKLLQDNRDTLDRVAEALLERETLEGKDLELLRKGEPLPPLPPPPSLDVDGAAAAGDGPDAPTSSREEPRKGLGGIPDPEPMPS